MVSDVYFPRINGVSTSIETFRGDLADCGVEVDLVVPDYPGATGAERIRRVAARGLPFDPEDRLMRWQHLQRTLSDLPAGIDLVHVQTPFAAHYAGCRYARRHALPVLATYHTHFEEYIHHYLPLLPRRLLRAGARQLARHQCEALDHVVVPSPAMQETLTGYGVTTPMSVLPTGIPVGQFASGERSRFRQRHGIAADRPVALYVGRVAFEKNIGFLLDAMVAARECNPDLFLVIAGEGPALPALRERTADLGLAGNVLFVGYLDRARDLPDCYAAADAFAFASRTETQGLVLLEAMAAGLPVHALACLGTRSIIEPGLGAIAAPDDPAAFGRSLAGLLADRPRLARMAAEGRRFAAGWSGPERARQLADLYRSLVV
jgi:glycosyltransferase involved in cell wall biosynthesis